VGAAILATPARRNFSFYSLEEASTRKLLLLVHARMHKVKLLLISTCSMKKYNSRF
jgi:hypothetical protein